MSETQPRGRNEAAEGSGNARRRWFSYLSTLDPRVLDITGFLNMTNWVWERYGNQPRSEHYDQFHEAAGKEAKEFAELVGFWVAWHTSGGFDLMEDHGWNRATIYRRIKKFRERFGAHPDDYDFDWITLDVEKSWNAEVDALLGSPQEKSGDDD